MKNEGLANYKIQKQLEELLLNRLINDVAVQRKEGKKWKILFLICRRRALKTANV